MSDAPKVTWELKSSRLADSDKWLIQMKQPKNDICFQSKEDIKDK
jgi:hypothetical protein